MLKVYSMAKKVVKQKKIGLLSEKLTKNSKVLEELEFLFDMVPPSYLKSSISELFFSYLCNTDQEDLKPEIKEIATDFYCLIKFLEVAEIYEREHETKKLQMKKD